MNEDPELAAWQRQWQAGADNHDTSDWEGLKARANRQSRRMRLGLILPILVTIGIGGHLLVRADGVLALEGWIFITITWIACLWIARGTWGPFGQSTAAFVDLAIRRSHSNLKGARLGLWLYIAQLVCVHLLSPVEILASWPMILLGWIGLPAYVIWMIWFRRKLRAELTRLFDLKDQLHRSHEP